MSDRTDGGPTEPDWKSVEDELLDRVKDVARRITERIKKVTEDTAPGPSLRPDEATGEGRPLG